MLPGLIPFAVSIRQPKVIQRPMNSAASRATSTVLTWAAAAAGNLIVIEFSCETNAAAPSTPAGYTLWPDGNKSIADNMTLSVFYKVATGGETGVTITHGSNETAWMMREINAPVGSIDFGTTVVATTINPDPPVVTPAAGGAKPTLNIAGAGFRVATVSAYPSGYSNGQASISTGANLVRVASSEKIGVTSTDNAGTLTLSASRASAAFSYSIR